MLDLGDAYKIFLVMVGTLTPVLGYVIRTEVALYRLRKGIETITGKLATQVESCDMKRFHTGEMDEQWKKAMENTLERICKEQEQTNRNTNKSMRHFEDLLIKLDKTVDRLSFVIEQQR